MAKGNLILPRRDSTTGCSLKSYPGHSQDFAIGETVSDEEKEILNLIKEKMENPNSMESVNLRAMDRKKVKEKLEIVNEVIDKVISRDITDTNRIILAAANVVADLVGMKRARRKMKLLCGKRGY